MEDIRQPIPERTYTVSSSSKKNRKLVRFLLIGIVLVGVGFGVFKLLGSSKKTDEAREEAKSADTSLPTNTPAPTIEATLTPSLSPTTAPTNTPTPKPTANPVDKESGLDRSKLSIEVLNGSGTAGVGKKASTFLGDLGYKIASTGNADHYNYEKVSIEIRSGKSDFLSLLKKDLSGSYSIGSSSASLSASSSADARIIVGK